MDKINLLWSKAFEDAFASKFFGVNATTTSIPINFMVQKEMNAFVYDDKVYICGIKVLTVC